MPSVINPPVAAYFAKSINKGQCAKCSGLMAMNPKAALTIEALVVRQFGPKSFVMQLEAVGFCTAGLTSR